MLYTPTSSTISRIFYSPHFPHLPTFLPPFPLLTLMALERPLTPQEEFDEQRTWLLEEKLHQQHQMARGGTDRARVQTIESRIKLVQERLQYFATRRGESIDFYSREKARRQQEWHGRSDTQGIDVTKAFTSNTAYGPMPPTSQWKPVAGTRDQYQRAGSNQPTGRTLSDIKLEPYKFPGTIHPSYQNDQEVKRRAERFYYRMRGAMDVTAGMSPVEAMLRDPEINAMLRKGEISTQHLAAAVGIMQDLRGQQMETALRQLAGETGSSSFSSPYLQQQMPSREKREAAIKSAQAQIDAWYEKTAKNASISTGHLHEIYPHMSDEQLAFVKSLDENPQAVLKAGPGTGKTDTLMAGWLHLVFNKGIDPSQINMVSVTKSGRDALYDRIKRAAELTPQWDATKAEAQQKRTMHSIFLRGLYQRDEQGQSTLDRLNMRQWELLGAGSPQSGQYANLEEAAEASKKNVRTYLETVLRENNVRRHQSFDKLTNHISSIKQNQGNRTNYESHYQRGMQLYRSGNTSDPDAVFFLYESNLKRKEGMPGVEGQQKKRFDLDDVPYLSYLAGAKQIAQQLKHTIVDEFQTMSPDMIRALRRNTGSQTHLLMAGDPGQRVMGSGYRPDEMIPKAFPQIGQYTLTGNYRGTARSAATFNAINQHPSVQRTGFSPPQVSMSGREGLAPTMTTKSSFQELYSSAFSDVLNRIGLDVKKIGQNIQQGAHPLVGASASPGQHPQIFTMKDDRRDFLALVEQELAKEVGSTKAHQAMGMIFNKENPVVGQESQIPAILVQQAQSRGFAHPSAYVTRGGQWDEGDYWRMVNIMESRTTEQSHYYATNKNFQYSRYPNEFDFDPATATNLPHGFARIQSASLENLVHGQGVPYKSLSEAEQYHVNMPLPESSGGNSNAALMKVLEGAMDLDKAFPVSSRIGMIGEDAGLLPGQLEGEYGDDARKTLPGFSTSSFTRAAMSGKYDMGADYTRLGYGLQQATDFLQGGPAAIEAAGVPIDSVTGYMGAVKPFIGKAKDPRYDITKVGGKMMRVPTNLEHDQPAPSAIAGHDDVGKHWGQILEMEANYEPGGYREGNSKYQMGGWQTSRYSKPTREADEQNVRYNLKEFLRTPQVASHPKIKPLLEAQYSKRVLLGSVQHQARYYGYNRVADSLKRERNNIPHDQIIEAQRLRGELPLLQTRLASLRENLDPENEEHQKSIGVLTKQIESNEAKLQQITTGFKRDARHFGDAATTNYIGNLVQNENFSKLGSFITRTAAYLVAEGYMSPELVQTLTDVAQELAGNPEVSEKMRGEFGFIANMLQTKAGMFIDHDKPMSMSEEDLADMQRRNPRQAALMESVLRDPNSGELKDFSQAYASIKDFQHKEGRMIRGINTPEKAAALGITLAQSRRAPFQTEMTAYSQRLEESGIADPQAWIARQGKQGMEFFHTGEMTGLEMYQHRLEEIAYGQPREGRIQPSEDQRQLAYQQLGLVKQLRSELHSSVNQEAWGHTLSILSRVVYGEGAYDPSDRSPEGQYTAGFRDMFKYQKMEGLEGSRTLEQVQSFVEAMQESTSHIRQTGTIKREHVNRIMATLGHTDLEGQQYTGLHALASQFGSPESEFPLSDLTKNTDLVRQFPSDLNNQYSQLTRLPLGMGREYMFAGGMEGFAPIITGNEAHPGGQIGMTTGMRGTLQPWSPSGKDFGMSKTKGAYIGERLFTPQEANAAYGMGRNDPLAPLFRFQESESGKTFPVRADQLIDPSYLPMLGTTSTSASEVTPSLQGSPHTVEASAGISSRAALTERYRQMTPEARQAMRAQLFGGGQGRGRNKAVMVSPSQNLLTSKRARPLLPIAPRARATFLPRNRSGIQVSRRVLSAIRKPPPPPIPGVTPRPRVVNPARRIRSSGAPPVQPFRLKGGLTPEERARFAKILPDWKKTLGKQSTLPLGTGAPPLDANVPVEDQMRDIAAWIRTGNKAYGMHPLSEEQRKAVESTARFRMVSGGPGGGKTNTIAGATGDWIATGGMLPANIVSVSALHSGEEELNSRLDTPRALVRRGSDPRYELPKSSTIHSLAHDILLGKDEESGKYPQLEQMGITNYSGRILYEPDAAKRETMSQAQYEQVSQIHFLQQQIPGLSHKDAKEGVEFINNMKANRFGEGTDYESALKQGRDDLSAGATIRIGKGRGQRSIPTYTSMLAQMHDTMKERGDIDYNDLLYMTARHLEQNGMEGLPMHLRSTTGVVLDEGQDITRTGADMVGQFMQAISGNTPSMLIGMDPAQSLLPQTFGAVDVNKVEGLYETMAQGMGEPLEKHTLKENRRSDLSDILFNNAIRNRPILAGTARSPEQSMPEGGSPLGHYQSFNLAQTHPQLFRNMWRSMLSTSGTSYSDIGANVQAGKHPFAGIDFSAQGRVMPKDIPAILNEHKDQSIFAHEATQDIAQQLGVGHEDAKKLYGQMTSSKMYKRPLISRLLRRSEKPSEEELAKMAQFPVVRHSGARSFDALYPHVDVTRSYGGDDPTQSLISHFKKMFVALSRVRSGGQNQIFATNRPLQAYHKSDYLKYPELFKGGMTDMKGNLLPGDDEQYAFKYYGNMQVPPFFDKILGDRDKELLRSGAVSPTDSFFPPEVQPAIQQIAQDLGIGGQTQQQTPPAASSQVGIGASQIIRTNTPRPSIVSSQSGGGTSPSPSSSATTGSSPSSSSQNPSTVNINAPNSTVNFSAPGGKTTGGLGQTPPSSPPPSGGPPPSVTPGGPGPNTTTYLGSIKNGQLNFGAPIRNGTSGGAGTPGTTGSGNTFTGLNPDAPWFAASNPTNQLARTLARVGTEIAFTGGVLKQHAVSAAMEGSKYRQYTIPIVPGPGTTDAYGNVYQASDQTQKGQVSNIISQLPALPGGGKGTANIINGSAQTFTDRGTQGFFDFNSGNPGTIGYLEKHTLPMYSKVQIVQGIHDYMASTGASFGKGSVGATTDIMGTAALAGMDPSQLMPMMTQVSGYTAGSPNANNANISQLSGFMQNTFGGKFDQPSVTSYLSAMSGLTPTLYGAGLNRGTGPGTGINVGPNAGNLNTFDYGTAYSGQSQLHAASLMKLALNAGYTSADLPDVGNALGNLAQIGMTPNMQQQYQLAKLYGEKNLTASPQYFEFQQQQLGQKQQIAQMQLGLNINQGTPGAPKLSVSQLQINATNASIALDQANLSMSQEQFAQNTASFSFNQWMQNQELGPIGATPQQTGRADYFAYMNRQMGAGYNPLNAESASTFQFKGQPMGLQNVEFYAGIEHQRNMLSLSKSPLLADAAYQEQMKYLNEQETFYNQQLQLQNKDRAFQQTWGQKSLNAQAGVLAAQQKQFAVQLEQASYEKQMAAIQAKFYPQQLDLLKKISQQSLQQIQGQGPINGQNVQPAQLIQMLSKTLTSQGYAATQQTIQGMGISAQDQGILMKLVGQLAQGGSLADIEKQLSSSGDKQLLAELQLFANQGAWNGQKQQAGTQDKSLAQGGTGPDWKNLTNAVNNSVTANNKLAQYLAPSSTLQLYLGEIGTNLGPVATGISSLVQLIGVFGGGGAGGAGMGGRGTGGASSMSGIGATGGSMLPLPSMQVHGPYGGARGGSGSGVGGEFDFGPSLPDNKYTKGWLGLFEAMVAYKQQKTNSSTMSHYGITTPNVNADFHQKLWYGIHQGVDFAAAQGTPLLSFNDGKVINTGFYPWGGEVDMQIPGGLTERYLHLSQIGVTSGQKIKAGDRLGLTGGGTKQSGLGYWSKGAHSHVQIDQGNINQGINPWVIWAAFGDTNLRDFYIGAQAQAQSSPYDPYNPHGYQRSGGKGGAHSLFHLAEGGIAMKPLTARLMDAGEPEAVIPLSKLKSVMASVTSGSPARDRDTTSTPASKQVTIHTLVGTMQVTIHTQAATMSDQEKDDLFTDLLDVLDKASQELLGTLQ